MDNKLTDEQIIKALKCCISATNGVACEGCPFDETDTCENDSFATERYALDLINRQKAENELKTMDIESLTNERNALEEMVAEQKAEIERLNVDLVGMRGACESYKMHYDESQANNKELWAERNRIYESLKETEAELEEYRKVYVNSQAEIERLKDFIEKDKGLILKLTGVPVEEYNQTIKSEAINDFAKRLREKAENHYIYWVTVDEIDNLVKEMTEGNINET